jgi:hypothetical protein
MYNPLFYQSLVDKKLFLQEPFQLLRSFWCFFMAEQRTQIEFTWLRKLKNIREASRYKEYVITVKQDPRIVYGVFKAFEIFKRQPLNMKLSKITGFEDWVEIPPEEINACDEVYCMYKISILECDRLNLTFNEFNNIIEQWEVDEICYF